MAQGLVIAAGNTLALTTADSADQIIATYQYLLTPGSLKLYARGSNAAVLVNLFVNGTQICRRQPVPFFGTTGGLDTSAHLVTAVNTNGGRVELNFTASTGTPTVDFMLTFEGFTIARRALNLLSGR